MQQNVLTQCNYAEVMSFDKQLFRLGTILFDGTKTQLIDIAPIYEKQPNLFLFNMQMIPI